jgi:hypothetical protein
MPDLSFLSAFVHNPVSLVILMVGGIIIVFIWKGLPYLKYLKLDMFDKLNIINQKIVDITATINSIKEVNDKQEVKLDNIIKDTLRLTIYQDNLSISERLLAARRYFIAGGNGPTRKYIEENLIKGNEELWNSIQRLEFADAYFKNTK